jgi:hypothetical protein
MPAPATLLERRIARRRHITSLSGLLACAIALSAAGCASTDCVPKPWLTGNVAVYSTRPDHKAIFMDADPKAKFHLVAAWAQATPEAAVRVAEQSCQANATSLHSDPRKCYPIAIDNKQTVFDPTALYCDADPARAAQDKQDFYNALFGVSNAIRPR